MKKCANCGNHLGDDVGFCPACGTELSGGLKEIGGYHLAAYLRPGYGSSLYRACPVEGGAPVLVRVYDPGLKFDEATAEVLNREMQAVAVLPTDLFVRHLAIGKTGDGVWYRVSEYLDALEWGELVLSRFFDDLDRALSLFVGIAHSLSLLHEKGLIIPHLTLDDLLPVRCPDGEISVKIDYKLSRHLDPALANPSPSLRELLEAHPDVIGHLPLDGRSDIWSLGKIFVDLLAGPGSGQACRMRLETAALPQRLKRIIGQMLESDPGVRPASMAAVAMALTDSSLRSPHNSKTLAQRFWPVGLLLTVAVFLGMYMAPPSDQPATAFRPMEAQPTMQELVDAYGRSIAYVLVEFWLENGGRRMTNSVLSEGTAFLVDQEGLLVTNRHVACPWLGKPWVERNMTEARKHDLPIRVGYKLYVWMEGTKAFRGLADLPLNATVADRFHIEQAYTSFGNPSAMVAGVVKRPRRSTLDDDIAVLRVDPVPAGVKAIPMALDDGLMPHRLAPIFTMGFPLGRSAIQDANVVASATQGHIRRVFDDHFQADVSTHPGNSGGPAIDDEGRAIGIVSAIMVDNDPAGRKPLSDFTLIQPITKALPLLLNVKSGMTPWNGIHDPSLGRMTRGILSTACARKWEEAFRAAEKADRPGQDQGFAALAGTLAFCRDRLPEARALLDKSDLADPDNAFPQFVSYLIDRRAGSAGHSRTLSALLALDWTSPYEFLGFLTRGLHGRSLDESSIELGETASENALLGFAAAEIAIEAGDLDKAEAMLRRVVPLAPVNSLECALAVARLQQVQGMRAASLSLDARDRYLADCGRSWTRFDNASAALLQKEASGSELMKRMFEAGTPEARQQVLAEILRLDPQARTAMVDCFYLAFLDGALPQAISLADRFLEPPGRESGRELNVELLRALILGLQGKEEECRASLGRLAAGRHDPWFQGLAWHLLAGRDFPVGYEETLRPEKALVRNCALGLWYEAQGNHGAALPHYRAVLESTLTNHYEYLIAQKRLAGLQGHRGQRP